MCRVCLTEICRVDWVKHSSVDLNRENGYLGFLISKCFVHLIESITGIDSKLLDLLLVLRVSIVSIAVRPEPQL